LTLPIVSNTVQHATCSFTYESWQLFPSRHPEVLWKGLRLA